MTGDVAEALAAMLLQQPHLRALNLNDTSLEDAGISTIAQALATSGDCTLLLILMPEGLLMCFYHCRYLHALYVIGRQTSRQSCWFLDLTASAVHSLLPDRLFPLLIPDSPPLGPQ